MAIKAILFDSTKCIACKSCQAACKQWNQLPADGSKTVSDLRKDLAGAISQGPASLTSSTWLVVAANEEDKEIGIDWSFARIACMHCTNAACQAVCPTGAISKTSMGGVIIDQNKCIGCQFCNYHCPYNIPKLNPVTNTSWKCWLCQDRIGNGLKPACVAACPTGTLDFGDRQDMLIKAKKRLAGSGAGTAYLYGEHELDGLNVLQILKKRPDVYGLAAHADILPATYLWQKIIRPAGLGALGITLAGMALSYILNVGNRDITKREGGGGSGDNADSA